MSDANLEDDSVVRFGKGDPLVGRVFRTWHGVEGQIVCLVEPGIYAYEMRRFPGIVRLLTGKYMLEGGAVFFKDYESMDKNIV